MDITLLFSQLGIGQSQKHGFDFENQVKTKVFGLSSEINNTDKYDIPCEKNILDPNENISIKSSNHYGIDCGDILRFFSYDFTKKNTIIIIVYAQKYNTKVVKEILEINYNQELHDILFGTITEEILSDYIKTIKEIPSGKCIDKSYLSIKKNLQINHNMQISISPKVDSHNQRRVQCSIKSIDKYSKFILRRGNLLRGVLIEPIKSPMRRRY